MLSKQNTYLKTLIYIYQEIEENEKDNEYHLPGMFNIPSPVLFTS